MFLDKINTSSAVVDPSISSVLNFAFKLLHGPLKELASYNVKGEENTSYKSIFHKIFKEYKL